MFLKLEILYLTKDAFLRSTGQKPPEDGVEEPDWEAMGVMKPKGGISDKPAKALDPDADTYWGFKYIRADLIIDWNDSYREGCSTVWTSMNVSYTVRITAAELEDKLKAAGFVVMPIISDQKMKKQRRKRVGK